MTHFDLHHTQPSNLKTRLLPEGVQCQDDVWIFGDVHGQAEFLENALQHMHKTPKQHNQRRVVVFLGDLIDRGPDSARCLQLAYDTQQHPGVDDFVGLLGNHELLLLDCFNLARTNHKNGCDIGKMNVVKTWLFNGGLEFCEQVVGTKVVSGAANQTELLNLFFDALGEHLMTFLQTFQSHWVNGNLLCVHAGLLGGKPFAETFNLPAGEHLSSQFHVRHWAWIRDKCLAWQSGWKDAAMKDVARNNAPAHLLVHGHTPVTFNWKKKSRVWVESGQDVQRVFDKTETHGRLNLDGGAAMGHGLTFAHFTNNQATIFHLTETPRF